MKEVETFKRLQREGQLEAGNWVIIRGTDLLFHGTLAAMDSGKHPGPILCRHVPGPGHTAGYVL